jgi:hypothetical protein
MRVHAQTTSEHNKAELAYIGRRQKLLPANGAVQRGSMLNRLGIPSAARFGATSLRFYLCILCPLGGLWRPLIDQSSHFIFCLFLGLRMAPGVGYGRIRRLFAVRSVCAFCYS